MGCRVTGSVNRSSVITHNDLLHGQPVEVLDNIPAPSMQCRDPSVKGRSNR
jgi:hypothetical protein